MKTNIEKAIKGCTKEQTAEKVNKFLDDIEEVFMKHGLYLEGCESEEGFHLAVVGNLKLKDNVSDTILSGLMLLTTKYEGLENVYGYYDGRPWVKRDGE